MDKLYLGFADISSLTKNDVLERLGEVPDVRRAKILAHKTDKGIIQSFGAGLLLEKMLARQGIFNAEIKISSNGKPYTDNNVFFNLSHSCALVMCAIGRGEVGCDVEYIREIKSGALRSAFLPYERDHIGDDGERFYTLWTVKESYIKFLGETIASLRPDKIKTKWVGGYGIEGEKVDVRCGRIGDYIYSVCGNALSGETDITDFTGDIATQ